MKMAPLPIDSMLEEIAEGVAQSANFILTATPGAGKTTRLPPELLSSVSGKVIVLQPRRMAAVAACERVCEERGWKVGGAECGYQVRFESRVTAATRLIFMTDALLLRQMIEDPELRGVDLVVLDEFHERGLNQDLILGLLRELQEMGRAIKIMIMSATLDTNQLMNYLPGVRCVEVPGIVHPLEIRHDTQALSLQTDREFYDRVYGAVSFASRATTGDVLVFLPGVGEIARAGERLSGLGREIVPLHGSLSLNEQRAALAPPRSPRIILATNVAEASVTVQGVDYVVDTGLAKVMDMNLNSGFSSLELRRISLFNARQRSGRAARQKAGVCLRLWTSHEETTQALEMPPECQRADLAQSLLLLAHFGVSDFSQFSWLDQPSPRVIDMAIRGLRGMGALDGGNRLTDFGRRLIEFPLPPRLAGLVVQADSLGWGETGAFIAAIGNERDFAEREATTTYECDLDYRLEILEDIERGSRPSGISLRQAQTVLESAKAIAKRVGADRGTPDVRKIILLSQKDRLCRRRGNGERGLMVGGRGVKLSPNSQVKRSDFFVALQGVDLPGQTETMVSMACGMSKAFVLEQLKSEIEVRDEIDFVEEKGTFFNKRVRMFRDLALEEPTLTPVDPAAVAEQMTEILVRKWDWMVAKNEALQRWMHRWNFLVRHAPDQFSALPADVIEKAVAMAAFGKTKIDAVLSENLVSFLEMSLPKDALRIAAKETPDSFEAPSGQSHRIHYDEGHSAFVEVRLQEIFGLLESPRLVFGKIPLTFRLLGPNYRPVQVTSDLASFWRSGYQEVRKELRLRYPKHSWPEDPYSAKPEAKGRRRN